MLYSSSEPAPDVLSDETIDSNAYPPFQAVDSAVVQRIMAELDVLEKVEEEGMSVNVLRTRNSLFSSQPPRRWLARSQRRFAVSPPTYRIT